MYEKSKASLTGCWTQACSSPLPWSIGANASAVARSSRGRSARGDSAATAS